MSVEKYVNENVQAYLDSWTPLAELCFKYRQLLYTNRDTEPQERIDMTLIPEKAKENFSGYTQSVFTDKWNVSGVILVTINDVILFNSHNEIWLINITKHLFGLKTKPHPKFRILFDRLYENNTWVFVVTSAIGYKEYAAFMLPKVFDILQDQYQTLIEKTRYKKDLIDAINGINTPCFVSNQKDQYR
jgi:hypothetical protein